MKHTSHLVREILETLALTLVIFVVIHFTVQNFMVDGTSMEPGLQNGQYVLVNKLAYLFHTPERGDVIVFHFPKDTNVDLIKRVIGVPGDLIVIDGKTVRVNGVLLNEPYIMAPVNPLGSRLIVPPNEYFVMGDNRPVSDDSRDWGFVPKNYIVGKAVLVYWPFTHWHIINTYEPVYTTIPASH